MWLHGRVPVRRYMPLQVLKTGQTGSRPGVTAFYMYIRFCQETISHDQEYADSPFVDSAPLLRTVQCLWELDVHSDVMMMYSAGVEYIRTSVSFPLIALLWTLLLCYGQYNVRGRCVPYIGVAKCNYHNSCTSLHSLKPYSGTSVWLSSLRCYSTGVEYIPTSVSFPL